MKKKTDYSLLVIKPEVITFSRKILESLHQRGYALCAYKIFSNWGRYVKKIYKEFKLNQLDDYLCSYTQNGWGDIFVVILVSHVDGDSINRLKKDQGDYIAYQEKNYNSLRREFGWGIAKNKFSQDVTFTYNGFHCVKDIDELMTNCEIFDINLKKNNESIDSHHATELINDLDNYNLK